MTLYFCKKGRSQQFQTVSPGKGAAAMQCYSLPFKEDAAKLLKCYYSSPKLISPLAVQIHVKCYFTRQAMPTNSLKSLPRKTCFSSGRLLSKMSANVIKLEDTWWKMKQPEMLLSGGRTLALVGFFSEKETAGSKRKKQLYWTNKKWNKTEVVAALVSKQSDTWRHV